MECFRVSTVASHRWIEGLRAPTCLDWGAEVVASLHKMQLGLVSLWAFKLECLDLLMYTLVRDILRAQVWVFGFGAKIFLLYKGSPQQMEAFCLARSRLFLPACSHLSCCFCFCQWAEGVRHLLSF